MTPEQANRVISDTPKKKRKMSPEQRARLRLVMAAFNEGVRQVERVRAGTVSKQDGTWWPELAPLRRSERKLVWTYLGKHFEAPSKGQERTV